MSLVTTRPGGLTAVDGTGGGAAAAVYRPGRRAGAVCGAVSRPVIRTVVRAVGGTEALTIRPIRGGIAVTWTPPGPLFG